MNGEIAKRASEQFGYMANNGESFQMTTFATHIIPLFLSLCLLTWYPTKENVDKNTVFFFKLTLERLQKMFNRWRFDVAINVTVKIIVFK